MSAIPSNDPLNLLTHRQNGTQTSYSKISGLKGLRKDHKGNINNDPIKGPKLCPLAAANKAPNTALGYLLAQIANAVGDNIADVMGTEVVSTKQLKHTMEEANFKIVTQWEEDVSKAHRKRKMICSGKPTPRQEMDQLVIFSMDVVSLYPSITLFLYHSITAVRRFPTFLSHL